MVYKIDYEHIFFDCYELSEEEKKKAAFEIVGRLFKDAKIDKEGCRMETGSLCAETEIELDKKQQLMKREFFVLLSRQEDVIAPKKEPDIIEIAEKYIREKYLYDYICASSVAEHCSVSRKVLDTGFVKRFSKSVSEYIRYIRVIKAAGLINSGEKMDNVAYLCGFGSIKTMQRAFRSVYGKTPSDYRGGRLDRKEAE